MAVPPLKDPADTMAVPPLKDPAATMAVPPLDDSWSIDPSPTAIMPPLSSESSSTVEVPAHRNPPKNPQSESPKLRNIQSNAPLREEDSGTPTVPAADPRYRRGKDKDS
jgi:hypothetical protein